MTELVIGWLASLAGTIMIAMLLHDNAWAPAERRWRGYLFLVFLAWSCGGLSVVLAQRIGQ